MIRNAQSNGMYLVPKMVDRKGLVLAPDMSK